MYFILKKEKLGKTYRTLAFDTLVECKHKIVNNIIKNRMKCSASIALTKMRCQSQPAFRFIVQLIISLAFVCNCLNWYEPFDYYYPNSLDAVIWFVNIFLRFLIKYPLNVSKQRFNCNKKIALSIWGNYYWIT